MAVANTYRNIKDVYDGVENYAYYTASGIVQGDFMQWDLGARVAVPLTAVSGAVFLGVCEDASPMASLGTAARPLLAGGVIRIKSQGIFSMKTTSGETYAHLDPIFMGADTQTVTKVSSGRMLGRVHLPNGTTVAGSSTAVVNVRIFGSMTNCGSAPSSLSGDA